MPCISHVERIVGAEQNAVAPGVIDQCSQQLFVVQDPWGGMARALWLSIFCAGGMAVLMALVIHDLFATLLFASLAVSNYLTLQQMGGGRGKPW